VPLRRLFRNSQAPNASYTLGRGAGGVAREQWSADGARRNAVSRILLLLVFLLWMSWTRDAQASLPVPARPVYGTAVFLGFYALLIAVIRLWSELLARRVTRNNLDRSLRGFGRVLFAVRFIVPSWFAVGLFLLGWGELVHRTTGRWAPFQLPGVLLGTLPPFAAWAMLWWSQYPADRTLREQSLLDELEADLPVHAPPTFRSYFFSNLRLQLLFTTVPVLAIILMRDVLSFAVAAWRGPGALKSEGVDFATMLLSTGLVFLLAPEILRRVLQTQSLPDSPLRRRLEALCRRVGMRYRDILLWRTQNNMGNAAVMGIIPPVRYILLSDLLLERMDDEQIEAVFAHEVGHVVHRHMAWYVVVILIFTLALLAIEPFVPKTLPALVGVPQGVLDVLLPVLVLMMFLVYFGFLSRRFERQADVYAARVIEKNAKERSELRVQSSGQDAPPELQALNSHFPAPDLSSASPVGEYGATVFASALHRVAMMNNIPLGPRRRPRRGLVRRVGHAVDGLVESLHNWLHGSIHHRMQYLRSLSADPAATGRFDRFMIALYCSLLFALFACAAFVVASTAR
jgi:STE24 endopeptidase